MDIRHLFRRSFLFNLAVVLLLIILLYVLFFLSLSWVTRHGKEIVIPDVIGRDAKIATTIMENMDFDVEIDSAYDPKQKALIVLSQMPDTGAVVKRGRTVFLTVNKKEAPLTSMPNLLNLSYRSAELMLRSNKLKLGDTTHRPDIAKGAVLDQLYRGASVKTGDMIPQGSVINLVIGEGLGNVEFDVPDVIGMSYNEAIAVLNANGLNFTVIWEGSFSDSAMAIVYRQFPKPWNELNYRNQIKEGDIVDIRVKQDPEEADFDNTQPANDVNTE